MGKGLLIAPVAPTVAPRQELGLVAKYATGDVQWSLVGNASGGTIDQRTGVYRAGEVGDVTDIVSARDSLGNTAQMPVNVTAALILSPRATTVEPGGSVAFQVSAGCGKGYVEKGGSGGSIDHTLGVYTAGKRRRMDVVTVTDACGAVARATVILGRPGDPADIAVLPEGHGVDGNCSYAPMTPRKMPGSVGIVVGALLALLGLRRRRR